MRIDLHSQDTMEGEPPFVSVYTSDRESARQDQTIDGARWEIPPDLDVAYAILPDRPGLVEHLQSEGYEPVTTFYFPL